MSGRKTTAVLVALAAGAAMLCGCESGRKGSATTAAVTEASNSTTSSAPATGSTASTTTEAPPRPATTGPTAPTGPTGSTVTSAPGGPAARVLATLAVKGRAPMTGYARDQFGQAWSDDNDNPLGHNGCDTRNDILRRDLTQVVFRPRTHDCIVASGILADPYTGRTVQFVRGQGTSTLVQIDHVVALADAWQKGAQQWSARRRLDFANDPLNLLAVDGSQNGAKGAGDAATWLPPNKAYRCTYVARQVAVKARYGVWLTAAERDAIAELLASCPGQTVPTEAGSPPP